MESPSKCGLLLCDDLIFTSKIAATARAHGLTLKVARTVEALTAQLSDAVAAVILELDHSPFDVDAVVAAVRSRTTAKIVCYGSHVDVERLKAARRAGCEVVLPRSLFVEKLESDIEAWWIP